VNKSSGKSKSPREKKDVLKRGDGEGKGMGATTLQREICAMPKLGVPFLEGAKDRNLWRMERTTRRKLKGSARGRRKEGRN